MTAFDEKRLGRVLLSEAFVTGSRSGDVFKNFAVLGAMPRYNEPGIIAYYGAHPDFEPYDGVPKNAPYYDPYWNDDGFYFKLKDGMGNDESYSPPADSDNGFIASMSYVDWLKKLDVCFFVDGLNRHDLEDYNWKDEYDSEVPPDEAYEEWSAHTEGGTRSPANF